MIGNVDIRTMLVFEPERMSQLIPSEAGTAAILNLSPYRQHSLTVEE